MIWWLSPTCRSIYIGNRDSWWKKIRLSSRSFQYEIPKKNMDKSKIATPEKKHEIKKFLMRLFYLCWLFEIEMTWRIELVLFTRKFSIFGVIFFLFSFDLSLFFPIFLCLLFAIDLQHIQNKFDFIEKFCINTYFIRHKLCVREFVSVCNKIVIEYLIHKFGYGEGTAGK